MAETMTPDCQHLRMKADLSATTSVMAIEFHLWGVVCEDCGQKWDIGQVMQSVVDATALRTRLEAAEKMVREAHEACHSEYMSCPWCSGHIGYGAEHHDEFCLWPAIAASEAKSSDE